MFVSLKRNIVSNWRKLQLSKKFFSTSWGLGIGDWGLGIGDWGLGIGDWGERGLVDGDGATDHQPPQAPIPKPQSPQRERSERQKAKRKPICTWRGKPPPPRRLVSKRNDAGSRRSELAVRGLSKFARFVML